MNDMLGIRTVPLGLNGNGGLYPQGNDKARRTRLVGVPILSLMGRLGYVRNVPSGRMSRDWVLLSTAAIILRDLASILPLSDGLPVKRHGRSRFH